MSDKQVTFQETFGQYPFPEGVLTSFAAYPTRVKVNRQARTMTVELEGERLAPNLVDQVQQSLARAFHLHQAAVEFHAAQAEAQPAPVVETPPAAPQPAPGGDLYAQLEAMRRKVLNQSMPGGGHGKPKVKQLYGKINGKKKPVPLGELQLDMGSVLVEGTVFNVEHRELPKRKAWVICFDITDNTGSIRVNQFLEGEVANPIVKGIKKGQRVQVQGRLNVSRFENDMVLEPYGINEVPMPEGRKDTAEEKRIELHLHTKMSMMDALCDGKAIVKRAIEWGHPAIAITDHGVVQSFPDAYNASGRGEKIKVLYGVEAYYQNDVDERVSVHGPGDMPLDGEFIAFDLETTGLDPNTDAIIEIGAVRMRGDQVLEHYSTFADPGHPLSPKTVSLTSITDEMVRGQRTASQAFEEFLTFCGGADLMGHNLPFDYGFLKQQAVVQRLPFEKRGIDTLKIARCLLDGLESRSLTSLCAHFHIDRSRAHRALDDALATHQLYCHLKELAGEDKVELFLPAPMFYRARKISPITDSQKRYLKDLAKYHRIELDVETDSLTKSEASRLIDRIIMNYGRIMR